MRIIHIGNLGNLAYNIVKFLRRRGIEADLLVRKGDEPTADPAFEDPKIVKNPPPWLVYWKRRHPLSMVGLVPKVLRYDIIQGYCGAPIYLQFIPKKYIAYSMGSDMRELAFEKRVWGKLMKRAYKKARVVIFSNPDQLDAIERLELKNTKFIPFIVDTERYKPGKPKIDFGYKLVIFHPPRLDWRMKGNDVFLRAFAKFAKEREDVLLILVDWGIDRGRTKALAKKLGINGSIKFVQVMEKRELIDFYNSVDIVADQFVLGSVGLLATEAMACGKPIIAYFLEEHFKKCYKELPPILNGKSEEAILKNLLNLTSSKAKCRLIGKKSREWAMRHHHWKKVTKKMEEIYESL